MDMRTQLIAIGNSRGIRIPAALIRECGLEGEVELEIRDGGLHIKASNNPRAGWEAAVQKVLADDPQAGEVGFVEDAVENQFDTDEWTW